MLRSNEWPYIDAGSRVDAPDAVDTCKPFDHRGVVGLKLKHKPATKHSAGKDELPNDHPDGGRRYRIGTRPGIALRDRAFRGAALLGCTLDCPSLAGGAARALSAC